MAYIPTETEIENAKSAAGGWTRATLAGWGVPWPPPKGWRKALIAQNGGEKSLLEVKREDWKRIKDRLAFSNSPDRRFEDEGGLVKRPVCTVKPGDTDCPFGPTGKRFPYLAEEDWQASLKRIAEQENSRAKDKVK